MTCECGNSELTLTGRGTESQQMGLGMPVSPSGSVDVQRVLRGVLDLQLDCATPVSHFLLCASVSTSLHQARSPVSVGPRLPETGVGFPFWNPTFGGSSGICAVTPDSEDPLELLQALFTTEERERITQEARKNIRGTNGQPATIAEAEEGFPHNRPNWDYNTAEGRGSLSAYRRALVAGLRGAARRPTNLAKVREIQQGPTEPPSVFLERLMEAYRRYTPFDPSSEGQKASVIMAFIGQSAPDIKRRLQRLEGLQDYDLRDVIKEAEKVYHKRESEEEKRERERREAEEREDRRDRRREKKTN
ncbi:uncharacterized protein LOC131397945 [Diceros bicornis minor]|uniref:uncharacterized protein LOC131397945 n=1 Tax=Diceros bicornis minor TaxID=77932 RepID=UPI0026F0942C|nr:uncharacterized protein LOC131397945 [Diceros bicornis minor]